MPTNRSSSSASEGNNGSTHQLQRLEKLEEIDRPLIVPRLWERHPYTVIHQLQGALVQMYPPPIGPKDDRKPYCVGRTTSGPWSVVRIASSKIVEEFWCDPLEQEKAKVPRISGAWLHTHNLYRGTIKNGYAKELLIAGLEDFDKAMKNAHGENWEEEHLDLDGQIIYEVIVECHMVVGIANRLFSKEEKVKFKSKRVMASGVDFDGIMQSPLRGPCDVRQHGSEKGMGSRTGGSTSHGNDDEDDYYDNEGDDNYGEDDLYGDEKYDYYGDDGYNDYEDGGYNDYGHGDVDWP
ncbi:hypothetical protein ZWY2020_005415 [Hordeum vulgare]|nr:hypothetical protein ZWY2020_005415 [Hordeum vulgare]